MVDLQCCVHPSSFNIAYRQSMKWENMFTNHLYHKGSRELPSGAQNCIKKDLNDTNKHDGIVTHLEPDILQ